MAEQKTKPTQTSVAEFLAALDPQKRADSEALIGLMQDVTGQPPVLWGSMVGFGTYHYRYASGHEGDAPLAAFAPRKSAITLYLSSDIERFSDTRARLGEHSLGKGCLYLKKLSDVDQAALRELVQETVAAVRQ